MNKLRLLVTAVVAALPVAAVADNVRGAWSAVVNWPLIPVHTVMTPDGRVLTYGTNGDGRQTGYFIYDIWNPAAGLNGGHATLPNQTGTDIFCGSQVVLAQSGTVFLAGGDNMVNGGTTNTPNNNTNIFNPADNSLTRGTNLNRQRWYSSSIALTNGEIYTQGGNGGHDRPEVRQTNGSFRLLSAVDTSAFGWDFPRNFVAPDGRVFGFVTSGQMYYVNPAGTGSISVVGQLPANTGGGGSSAVMFRPGRILQTGGPSNAAYVIDITGGGNPVVTATTSMLRQRQLHNVTVMADGKVLATGGSQVSNDLIGVSYEAEIWDPSTGRWTVGASEQKARLYHSGAILMPDASVLVLGGGAPGPQTNTNVEVYYPPYLFNAAGQRATQPTITAAPTDLTIGQTFRASFADATNISRVTLVKTSSVTHSFNMDQRFIELTFNRSGSQLTIQAPTRAGEATPGYYMLFVIDDKGVPSKARILRIGVAGNPNPAITPLLTNPGARSNPLGVALSLALVASDPNGDVLGYGASGLPPGLSINASTGVISGTPNAGGSYNVVVAASDGNNTATQSFVWTITTPVALVLNPTAPPTAIVAGNSVTLTASSSNGINPRYRWTFGDGTAQTAWSSSPTIQHSYAAPGVYYITLSATDDRGVELRQTIAQRVYFAATARRPSISSSMAYVIRNGAKQLWVVNPDTDTVSVFDAANNTRLREIAVGNAPRTLAQAPDGSVWVVNKDSATISVVNPDTFMVSRTIALPRGVQPFGVAFVPGGSAAFVAAEGIGRVYKLNASTGAQLAVTTVGANPRHVSVSADGTQVFVSRFITGRIPGENTATVTPVVNGVQYGGEVSVLNASDLSVLRTIGLRFSDKPDFENSGAGVPNYLGATTISPDGRSAWVPSKQDNIARGTLRNNLNLNFQNTVRAISSRIDLATGAEDYAARIDHDNAGLASAAAFDPQGNYLFVALETSREVAVVNAYGKFEVFRFAVGRAPQGVVVSDDGTRLYVNNFMDRSVQVFDLTPLMLYGQARVNAVATLASITTEKLSAQVLRGKQFFYDAKDARLARDAYVSCASCHNDGGHDGRTWDLTGFGEGLRNTIALNGRSGAAGHGFLHWSANFDEVQDFEGQIRSLAAGTGLMTDAQFNAGTRSQSLGDRKTGVSADLDALAAYVTSLDAFAPSPYRNADATLTAAGLAGREVFRSAGCAACHSGTAFTNSLNASTLKNVGTVKASSGKRLGGALVGLDVPTLRDVWATGPWLHDGTAGSIEAAIQAHSGVSLSSSDLANLGSYVRQIGSDEGSAPTGSGGGKGLTARYYANEEFSGTPAVVRVESPTFDWGTGSPDASLPADGFSAVWSGKVEAPLTGSYTLQTIADDGVRVWLNGALIIDNWSVHPPTTNSSAAINLVAGRRYAITVAYFERSGGATLQLGWKLPGASTVTPISSADLFEARTPALNGTGLYGAYYGDREFGGSPLLTRVENINFDWGTGAPAAGVPSDNFSAVWAGVIEAPVSGAYQLQTSASDGIMVWLNNDYIINNWDGAQGGVVTSPVVYLEAGQRYEISVLYQEKTGAASARLLWKTPGAAGFVAIPARAMYVTGNLVEGRPAKQSSTYSTAVAGRASDGNADGNYGAGSVAVTNNEAQAWWQTDLGASLPIGQLMVFNRTDCCSARLGDFYVFVSDSDMSGRTLASLVADANVWREHVTGPSQDSYSLTPGAHGRYVRVQLAGSNFLQLAEVVAYGVP